MWDKALVVGAYFGVLLLIGFVARRWTRSTAEDYFIASRSLSPIVLFLTMAATNFSAFTVFGFSGAGWRQGYAFYPIMAFGTGFMALSFHFIGRAVWQLGKKKGLFTPPELVFDRFASYPLRFLFLAVMAVFTVPYLAMQPMAAGFVLEQLLGIPYFAGAALITVVMLVYTLSGGFRAIAWTDVFQGTMMFVLLVVALAIISSSFGGLSAANNLAASRWPELFSRPGMGGAFSPGIWCGYLLLWFFADPMLPQMFQRFYAARDKRALGTAMAIYPLITAILFLLPVSLGVLGRLAYPELPMETNSDQILPLLLGRYVSGPLEALVLTAALAALMSTLDSQLLSLSSMLTRDLVEPLFYRHTSTQDMASKRTSTWLGRLFVAGLALAGLGIAWHPPATFLEIATEAFSGLAVLFPTVLATLYWKRATAKGAFASILIGEGLVVLYHFELLPNLGLLPVVPVVAATTLTLIVVSLITRSDTSVKVPIEVGVKKLGGTALWGGVFLLLFALGNDYWAWGNSGLGPLGYPWWLWYSFALCLLTALAFWGFSRRENYDNKR
ncbi:MAG: sodium:solute symporter family protein [Candidatus Bipolaricaulota bacterium]|nr:sodium:solute symporter family protein [Candidatus Bipolaricaulota bacterium]